MLPKDKRKLQWAFPWVPGSYSHQERQVGREEATSVVYWSMSQKRSSSDKNSLLSYEEHHVRRTEGPGHPCKHGELNYSLGKRCRGHGFSWNPEQNLSSYPCKPALGKNHLGEPHSGCSSHTASLYQPGALVMGQAGWSVRGGRA